MTELSRSRRERAFVASVQAEISAGTPSIPAETVRRIIGAYHAEAYRFDCLALDVAYHIEIDDSHLDTMYREFTTTRNRLAEVDAFGIRDQLDREDAKEDADGA